MKLKSLLTLVVLTFVAIATVRADAGNSGPVPVRAIAPEFPYEMRREGIGGVVTIMCVIDEHGNVQQPEVVKATHDAFVNPAMDALRKWKFKPARKDGVAIAQKVTIPIQFSVNRN